MAEWVSCSGCSYLDWDERDGYKCYCEWYETYEDPDEVKRECQHYRED